MNKYTQEVNQLIQVVQKHPAWWGDISGQEAEEILKGYPVYSYLLRSGENGLHYFFSYMTHPSVVMHKSIRINTEALGYYPNGGTGCKPDNLYYTVDQLISDFLGCSEENLLPLSSQLAQVQGF